MKFVAILALTLAGCGGTLVKVAEPSSVQVTWVRDKPSAHGLPNDRGYAKWSAGYKECTIYMSEDETDYVIAHEFKHCFGWVH